MTAVRRLSSPVFIGRLPELTELRDAYRRAAAGVPSTIVVAGEAGVGKTRFLGEFAAWAEAAGGQVLRGACLELGQGVLRYAPLVEALRPLVRDLEPARLSRVVGPGRAELARLLPDLAPDVGVDDRPVDPDQGRLFELLLGVFDRLAQARPTVLIVEDLHWADESIRNLFAFLARNLAREQLLLIASYRSDDVDRRHPLRPFLAELDRAGVVGRLELKRFSAEEVRAQLRAIADREPDSDVVAAVFARSEGNAFFTEELLAAETMAQPTGLSPTLRDILNARIERVSQAGLAILQVVAVAGRSVDERLLATVTALDEDELSDGLRQALAHQIFVPLRGPDGDVYSFRHALLQEAVYSDLLAGERKRLHRLMAEALTSHPEFAATDAAGAMAELAHHWDEARRLPEALAASLDAAVAAEATYAYPEALAHYERALDLWDEVTDPGTVIALDRVELAQRAASAAGRTRNDRRAVALLQAALAEVDEETDSARAGQLYAALAAHLQMLGDLDTAQAAVEKGFQLVPAEPPTAARSLLLRGSAWRAFAEGRYADARALDEEAASVARLLPGGDEPRDDLMNLHDPFLFAITTFAGDVDAGLAYANERLRRAEADRHGVRIASAWFEIGFVLQADLRFDEAAAAFLRGATIAAQHGLARSLGSDLESAAAEALRRTGRWAEADVLARGVIDRGGPGSIEGHEVRALLLASTGMLGQAEWHARAVWNGSGGNPSVLKNHQYYPAVADISIWRGQLGQARVAIARGLQLYERIDDVRWVGELVTRGLRVEADAAEVARAERSPERAEGAAERATQMLDRIETVARRAKESRSIFARESDAPVLLARAEWSRLQGMSDPELWNAAATAWPKIHQPYQGAYARYREAEALLARGARRDTVVPALRDAREIASRLGAAPLLDEIDALARRARLPIGSGRTREDPKDATMLQPDPLAEYRLTDRERQVLALLGIGSSDRQIAEVLFISDKTVSVHVSNIKGKLGVTTRLQAATLGSRLGAGEPVRASLTTTDVARNLKRRDE